MGPHACSRMTKCTWKQSCPCCAALPAQGGEGRIAGTGRRPLPPVDEKTTGRCSHRVADIWHLLAELRHHASHTAHTRIRPQYRHMIDHLSALRQRGSGDAGCASHCACCSTVQATDAGSTSSFPASSKGLLPLGTAQPGSCQHTQLGQREMRGRYNSGHCTARELQAHTAWPKGDEGPLHAVPSPCWYRVRAAADCWLAVQIPCCAGAGRTAGAGRQAALPCMETGLQWQPAGGYHRVLCGLFAA